MQFAKYLANVLPMVFTVIVALFPSVGVVTLTTIMLIPKILRNDVQYVNTNHKRDFIHIDDLMSAIDILMKSKLNGVIDIGTGNSYQLTDIINYFKIDCEKKIGSENERLDNKADITTLNSLGWKPKINLYDYIKENRNVN